MVKILSDWCAISCSYLTRMAWKFFLRHGKSLEIALNFVLVEVYEPCGQVTRSEHEAATFTVFPQPAAPPASYSTRPYVGRGRSFNDRKGFKKPGGRGRGQGRSKPSTTSTKPGQSKEGQSKSHETTPLRPPEKPSVIFEGTRIKVITMRVCSPHK